MITVKADSPLYDAFVKLAEAIDDELGVRPWNTGPTQIRGTTCRRAMKSPNLWQYTATFSLGELMFMEHLERDDSDYPKYSYNVTNDDVLAELRLSFG